MISLKKDYKLLSDYDYTDNDFLELIDEADMNVNKSEDLNLISKIREAHEEYGQNMPLSIDELNSLLRIADDNFIWD